MFGFFFPDLGNFIIPTDELIYVSMRWLHQPVDFDRQVIFHVRLGSRVPCFFVEVASQGEFTDVGWVPTDVQTDHLMINAKYRKDTSRV